MWIFVSSSWWDKGPSSQSLFFPVVMYGYERWTIKKAAEELIILNCGVGRHLSVPWIARRTNQSILKEISPEYSLKDWCWSSNTLTIWCEELTPWRRPWCWEILKAGGKGDDRRWDGWMASPTQWAWVWASSGSWWWTGKPGVLQSMWWQRVRHD